MPFLQCDKHKYILIPMLLFLLCGMSFVMGSSFAYAQNGLGSFLQNFGANSSSQEPAPFAPMESLIPGGAPTLEMMELFMKGGAEKLPAHVKDFLMKNTGNEPLPFLVSPLQTNNRKTIYSDKTSTFAKVPQIQVPQIQVPQTQVPQIKKPKGVNTQNSLVFNTIVSGMTPLFNPTMDLSFPSLQAVRQVKEPAVKQVEKTFIEQTEKEVKKDSKSLANQLLVKPSDEQTRKYSEQSFTKQAEKNSMANVTKQPAKQLAFAENSVSEIHTDALIQETKNNENNENKKAELETKITKKAIVEENLTSILHRLNVNDLRLRAESGDAKAQHTLGMKYYKGLDVEKNPKKALEWIQKSAKANFAPAMVTMGKFWENGILGDINNKRAAFWYKKAADQGNADALFYLALLYDTEKLSSGTAAKRFAMGYYRQAASMDHPQALYNLALFYDTDEDATRDMGQAVQLYRQSAHLGSAQAQLEVGLLYENGNFLPQNDVLAYAWYSKAAMQGLPIAQYLIAGMYLRGKGVPKNLDIAMQLYEVAATQGCVDAQFDIGLLYLTKKRAFYDEKKGKQWLEKAAAQGDVQAQDVLRNL